MFPRRDFRLLILLALASLAAAALAWPRPLAATQRVAGLSAPVSVIRDRWGVPHVFASTPNDLWAAQGYVTAQDRLWQMLLRRQAARGQLAAWLGESAAGADEWLNSQEFYASAWREMALLDASTHEALQAYAAGVNAYLDQPHGSLPIEFTLLQIRGVQVSPEPWTAQDSLAIALLVDWAQTLVHPDAQLGSDLAARLGAERASDLLHDISPRYPSIPRSPQARQVLRLAAWPLLSASPLSPAYSAPALPPAWYMLGLHSPSYQAAGASVSGMPGVVAGRGQARVWSLGWSQGALLAGYTGAACSGCAPLQDVRQPDTTSEPARRLTPYLVALEPQGWLQQRVTSMMSRWDYDLEAASAPAAVYEAWACALGQKTFADELGPELYARYAASGRAASALARLAARPDDAWWDDLNTPQRETRDQVMQLAYADALEYLGRHYGDLHTIWEWGQMHAATFEHALGGEWPASLLLDRGPTPLGGDGDTWPPAPFDAPASFEPVLAPALTWRADAGGELSFALAGEQSGALHIGPGSRLPAWQAGRHAPLLWDEADIRANASNTLALLP